jgi:hypothetical protein
MTPLRGGLVLLLLLATTSAGCRRPDDAPAAPGADPDPAIDNSLGAELYFPTGNGLLAIEPRPLALSGDTATQVRALLTALLEGPREEGLAPLFDTPVTLLEVYLDADGTAFADLGAADQEAPPAIGSTEELQVVYSLVNTVALNVSGVHRVVLLWNGHQRETWAGHVDTARPLSPRPELTVP